jgi:hypothetical protein
MWSGCTCVHRRLTHGSFESVTAATEPIEVWAVALERRPNLFVRHTPPTQIIAKIRRGRARTRQIKPATDSRGPGCPSVG